VINSIYREIKRIQVWKENKSGSWLVVSIIAILTMFMFTLG
jgi:hypothetical protein